MSDSIASRFIRGTLSVGLSRFMTMALSMLSLALVIRRISAEAYGAFVLIRIIYTLFAEMSNLGLSLVIPKYLASRQDVQFLFGIINTAIYFRILIILITIPIILVLKTWLGIAFGSSPTFVEIFIYVPILFAVESLAGTLTSILQGLFRFKILGIIVSVSGIINFIATIVFVFPLHMGVRGLIYAQIISRTLIVILCYAAAQIKNILKINIPILKEMLIFGFPLQIQYILDFIFSRADALIVGSYLGTTGIAFYEIARKLPDSLMHLYDSFRSVYYPFIAKFHEDGEHSSLVGLLNNSNRFLGFFASLGTIVAVLFGKEIISIFFSKTYLASYYCFVFLMFGLNLSILDNTLGYSLVAIGDPQKPLFVNLVRAIASLLLNLLVIPTFGFNGASIVSVVSNATAAPLDVYFLQKKGIGVEKAAFVKPIAISFCCGLIFLLTGASRLPVKLLFLIFFLSLCLLFSVVTRQDLGFLSAEAKITVNRFLHRDTLSDTRVQ